MQQLSIGYMPVCHRHPPVSSAACTESFTAQWNQENRPMTTIILSEQTLI